MSARPTVSRVAVRGLAEYLGQYYKQTKVNDNMYAKYEQSMNL